MNRKRKITWIVLAVVAVSIKIFSFFPLAVEQLYSTGIYPVIARLQRIILGWIPFSAGDIFYLFVAIWLAVKIFSFFRRLFLGRIKRAYFLYLLQRIVFLFLWIYVLFNLLWGLNYNRAGIAYQLKLEVMPYSTQELSDILQLLVDR